MISKLLVYILGFIFALGLGISQMTRPQKIVAFLDVLGDWDPSLLVVMVGAIIVYNPIQKIILKRKGPKYETKFTLPKVKELDGSLIIGAAIFGIGWGLVGLCPGPSITALGSGLPQIVTFVLGMFIGMLGNAWFKNWRDSVKKGNRSDAEEKSLPS